MKAVLEYLKCDLHAFAHQQTTHYAHVNSSGQPEIAIVEQQISVLHTPAAQRSRYGPK